MTFSKINQWVFFLILMAFLMGVGVVFQLKRDDVSIFSALKMTLENKIKQTDVDRAEHLFDAKGVPILNISGFGEQRHPGGIAVYALAYADLETYDPFLRNLRDLQKFNACVDWLAGALIQRANGLWLWEYNFDNTYNDISIKAPWSSAFAQATGIQALLASYRVNKNKQHLALALKAAKVLFVPIQQGGLLFQSGDDVWFEEIAHSADNPGHILNGHMRVLLALKELVDITGDEVIQYWLTRGTDTLFRWLPLYDSGYTLRYDLNPRKKELLFRFANPNGLKNWPLMVSKITLNDPVNKQEVVLNVGTAGDTRGEQRISGAHWGKRKKFKGRTTRSLIPAVQEHKLDKMTSPYSYFYLSLPSEWKNNLRSEWHELIIDYYDDASDRITIQQRSIAPGQTFQDLRGGDLHLTGEGRWRRWIVPIRSSDLGYWVGLCYAEKHAAYLAIIASWDQRFIAWAKVAKDYAKLQGAH